MRLGDSEACMQLKPTLLRNIFNIIITTPLRNISNVKAARRQSQIERNAYRKLGQHVKCRLLTDDEANVGARLDEARRVAVDVWSGAYTALIQRLNDYYRDDDAKAIGGFSQSWLSFIFCCVWHCIDVMLMKTCRRWTETGRWRIIMFVQEWGISISW